MCTVQVKENSMHGKLIDQKLEENQEFCIPEAKKEAGGKRMLQKGKECQHPGMQLKGQK
jgi:hypothetical protein